MKEGNLVESGSPKELLDNPSSVFKQYFQQNQQTAPTGGRPPLGVVPAPGEGGLGVKITQIVAGGLAAITGCACVRACAACAAGSATLP
jgi:hypothetical protein